MVSSAYLRSLFMLNALVLSLGLFSQKWNGGVADGYDAGNSANNSNPIVSKFTGGMYDGYTNGLSGSYSSILVSRFSGGSQDGYASLTGVYQALNIGVISGTVKDQETGMPLYMVKVKVSGGAFTSSQVSTGLDGKFSVHNVPLGTGYKVTAIKSGYETMVLSGINLSFAYPFTAVVLSMYPLNGPYYLQPINPNPNPAVSEVYPGAFFHRYYKVVDENGLACPDATVVVQSQSGTLYDDDFVTDADGIVDIAISCSDVGSPGQSKSFNIIRINNQIVSSPVSFSAQVIPSTYSKYWETMGFAEIGGIFSGIHLSAEMERGSVVSLVEENAGNGDPEHIDCERQARTGGGVGFKVKTPAAKCQLGPVKAKLGAEAGVGVKCIGIVEDSYRFGYHAASGLQAVARFIITADGGFNGLDNTLIRLLTVCERYLTNQQTLTSVFVSDAIGLDVVMHGGAEASAGVGVGNLVGIGAGANIGAEGHVTFKGVNHYKENLAEFEVGLSGTLQGNAEAGIVMEFSDKKPINEVKTMLELYDISSTRGISISVMLNGTSGAVEAYQIRLTKSNSSHEEQLTYRITGPQAMSQMENLETEIKSLKQSATAPADINIENSTFNRIIDKVFNFLFSVQGSNPSGASVTYSKEVTEVVHSGSVNLGIGLGITVLDAEIGAGAGFKQGKAMTVTEGRWVYGKHFPEITYSGSIPEIPKDHQEVIQRIIDEVPLSVRVLIGLVNLFIPGFSDGTMYIGTQGSYIVIPDGAVPAGMDTISCHSWGWYGDTITDRPEHLPEDVVEIYQKNRDNAEELYGMTYGIGGFYQFEPYDSAMLDTCMLHIVYTQDEVEGIDESTLGVYWEDKGSQRWRFLGGVVDTVANTVVVPVTFLSLFTLAPSQPSGGITLVASPDSIMADSLSVSLLISDTIYNSDSTIVKDGSLFTVTTNRGAIFCSDADTVREGIQVASLNGMIQFTVLSSNVAGEATVSAFSTMGSASGNTTLTMFDTIAPIAPLHLKGVAGDQCAYLSWIANPEADISGYKIYFDTDSALPPYEGRASVSGYNSPVLVGKDTNYLVKGLYNDSAYYFTITAYDVSGNESPCSNVIWLDLSLSDTLLIGYNEIKNRDTLCFNATGLVELPAAYDLFKIDSGGSVTVIAGEKVLIKAGFMANRGGYFHARITHDSSFCNFTPLFSIPQVGAEPEKLSIREQPEANEPERPFLIYPNPTSGNFTLTLIDDPSESTVIVTIFNSQGSVINKRPVVGNSNHEFSLSGQPAGIYLVCVVRDDRIFCRKIILK